jgi:hypothetical protein
MKQRLQEVAALGADVLDMVNGQELPLGGLFPEELANEEWVVISNQFTASSLCQDVCDPFEGIFLRHSNWCNRDYKTIAVSFNRLGVKRFQTILVEVDVVFVGDFSEELGELGVEILYHSSDTQDGNGGSVVKLSRGDGFVEVLSFVVSIDGCFGDLIDIETQPEGFKSQKPGSRDMDFK